MELSQVMKKTEEAQGRLQKGEEKLFAEGFEKKSFFNRIDNEKD